MRFTSRLWNYEHFEESYVPEPGRAPPPRPSAYIYCIYESIAVPLDNAAYRVILTYRP